MLVALEALPSPGFGDQHLNFRFGDASP